MRFRLFAVTIIAVLSLGGSLLSATGAFAAPVAATVTDQKFDKTEAGGADSIQLSFNWSIPDTALSGDTFTITLPNEIKTKSTAGFALKTTQGETAANAEWSGKTLTFTLTDYVNTNGNVAGTAYFNIGWDRDGVDMTTAQDYSLQFTGSTSWALPLTLIPDGPAGDGQSLSKTGWWLSDDQGASSSIKQLGWVVYLATGTSETVDAPLKIVDTPGAGSRIDVETVAGFVNSEPLPADRYTVKRSGDNGITIELQGNYPGETAVYPGENIYFTYSSDLLPGENGVFTNSAVVTEGTGDAETISSVVNRDGAGGDGEGDINRVPPVSPTVEQAICDPDTGGTTKPKLTLASTPNVTYVLTGDVARGETVTITATAAEGYQLSESQGWTLSEDGTATMIVTFDQVECEIPVTPVPPVTPEVTEAVCDSDGSTLAPVLSLADTEGITYTVEGEIIAGGQVTVKATAAEGYQLSESQGWTLSEDGTATMIVTFDQVECEIPVTPVDPSVPGEPLPAPPADSPPPPLANTGFSGGAIALGCLLTLLFGVSVVQIAQRRVTSIR